MAVIMVDYENVGAAHGMHGVEYLTKRDTLYIFIHNAVRKFGQMISMRFVKAVVNFMLINF